MTNILHLDCSPRGDRSISRQLTQEFITAWKTLFPKDSVTYRDLGHYPVPFLDEAWIAALFTPNLAGGAEARQQLLANARKALQNEIAAYGKSRPMEL